MKKAWLFIAVTLALDAVVGLAGGMLSDRWLRRHQPALVGFAAGALLTAAFVDILPSSVEAIGRDALTWAFVGFIAFAAIEWLVGHHHHQQGAEHTKTLPASLLLADALHNVGDGAAVAAAFLTSTRAGIAVALAVVAHEVPQEVGDFVVLRAAGLRRGAALAALAAVQLAAVVGAVVVVMAAESFGRAIHVVLSLAAGTFLYIGATDLLPELHSGHTTADRRERMFGFVAGIVVVLIASAVAGGLTETGSVRL